MACGRNDENVHVHGPQNFFCDAANQRSEQPRSAVSTQARLNVMPVRWMGIGLLLADLLTNSLIFQKSRIARPSIVISFASCTCHR